MKRLIVGLAVVVVAITGEGQAGIITADVDVLSPGGQYAPLEVGTLWNNWFQYYWYDVPAFAEEQDFLLWEAQLTGFPSVADGITTFEVLTDGPVLMACTTRWGGGGNSSGDWIPELTTQEELEEQGWVEFATGLTVAHVGYPYPEGSFEYIVFRRDSVAGETFTYRTEKYVAPLIIRSQTVVPEPSTLATLGGLLGMALIGYGWRRYGGSKPPTRPVVESCLGGV